MQSKKFSSIVVMMHVHLIANVHRSNFVENEAKSDAAFFHSIQWEKCAILPNDVQCFFLLHFSGLIWLSYLHITCIRMLITMVDFTS